MLRIKYMYKIHTLSVAQGRASSMNTPVFYETEEEALREARHYVEERGATGIVVYKAHVLVQPNQPPVEILSINRDGEVIPLR